MTCSPRRRSAAANSSAPFSGMEDELHDARAVAQVDEDQAAVVAAAVHPAGDARRRAGALGAEVAAHVSR